MSTAMSLSGSAETIRPLDRVPSTKESRIVVASSTTWSAVRIAPLALTITPVPSPVPSPLDDALLASIWTSDGRICW